MDGVTPLENRPALLVSVRNAAEARSAMAGGCDILDVKEPSRGPLGMADVETIEEILVLAGSDEQRTVGQSDSQTIGRSDFSLSPIVPPSALFAPLRLSVALGEVVDWLDCRRNPELPVQVDFAKLAFADCGGARDWPSRWLDVRRRFEQVSVGALKGQADSRFHWVAVAYADWENAHAPSPDRIVEAAAQTGCAAVLIDTFSKDGRNLLDCLSLSELRRLAEQTRRSEMRLGLAGSLQPALLPVLVEVQPDIIGIRSAACHRGCRSAPISPDKVRAFRDAMTSTFGTSARRTGASNRLV